MDDIAFRRALAMMIDRDFMTEEVFQGEVEPTWALLLEGNKQYYDPEAAAEIASKHRAMDRFERLEAAVAILEEAGYTWDEKPAVGRDERGEPCIEPGSRIQYPGGTLVQELEILSFGAGVYQYHWFASYALYIERWLQDLGFSAVAATSTGPTLVGEVWPGIGQEPTFDIYLLGWSLGSPAFPTFHESFFHSRNLAEANDGNNPVGYVNPEVDHLTEQLNQVKTTVEAKEILWQLEGIIDRDLPYVTLLSLTFHEAYTSRVEYPFTDTLGGPWFYSDLHSALVRIRE
jgi:ABC-type transport system substrate-binding protein